MGGAGPDTSGGDALSHIDERGEACMVDVGRKPVTSRMARAGVRVWMEPNTMKLLQEQALPKGDVLAVARVAGIMAAKKTSELIPLCHPLPLDQVEIAFRVAAADALVEIECTARTDGKTGVEMEAITGAAVAAVTIYDMCKAIDRGIIIGDLRLLEKSGGKEDYVRGAGWGRVVSVNVSRGKGERKQPVEVVELKPEHGIVGDGHAGDWHRQVSFLASESIAKMQARGLDVAAGAFAENITTMGLDLVSLPVGTKLAVGPALLELTQIGKVCHERCAIYYQAGDCVMPREGVFARVLRGGKVRPGDPVRVQEREEGQRPEGEAGAAQE